MSTRDPLIGQQFGNYLIQQPLGRGGMAQVYKGLDVSLKRPVAIKMIDEGLRQSSTYAQRFEREAQSVASLKHPNIVTVFHFGVQENRYYLVMEYIDGADLDAIMRNYENTGELMPYNDVIRILDAIGSALDYAHEKGVIHRDIKPSNIMLERGGRPVLTDFGLALRVSEGTVGDTFGSPHYISPEQAQNSANAGPQSDLYSLGVVAYELLAGVVPFDDPNPTTLAIQHMLTPVPSPRLFNRNLSESVEQVLFKILDKKPEDRYQTGAEFVAAMRQSLDALKQNPVKTATTDLPPLPPGMTPPPPRRLSMQTTVDKIDQELALADAKGQSLTRTPLSAAATAVPRKPAPPKKTPFSAYLIAGGGAILALVVVGVILTAVLGQAAPTASTPSPTIAPTSTPLILSPTSLPTATAVNVAVVASPSATVIPSATTTPTSTITSTMTRTSSPIPPTVAPPTQIPPSPTITPSLTPTQTVAPSIVPPTATVISAATAIPQADAAPTVLYPDGLLFVFVWDQNGFYAANESGQKVLSSSLSFDRIMNDGQFTNHFSGNRWALNYAYSETAHCLILNVQGKAWRLPTAECPEGYNSQLYAYSNELFWTPLDGSTAFRVLWLSKEVGRCIINQLRCEVRMPH